MLALLFALFLCLPSWAFHQVQEALDHHTLLARLDPAHNFIVGDRVVIISPTDQTMVAIAIVKDVNRDQLPETAVLEVGEIFNDQIIMPGDAVERLSVEALDHYHVNGHISLLLGKDDNIPAKYKELAYFGAFNADGHNLAKNEWLVSIPQVQYGVSEDFTLKVHNSLYLDGFANLGAKWRLMRSQWGQLTANTLISRQINRNDWVVLSGFILTLPSNGKFETHLVVNARLDGIEEENPEVDKLNLFPESDIRTIYEYVTDDWNRVLFGPLFNFQTHTVGGTVSYMWIWNTFHLNLGVATKDVAELEFARNGYNIIFDFFWRF